MSTGIDPHKAMMVDGELIQVTSVTIDPDLETEKPSIFKDLEMPDRPHVSVSAIQQFLKCRTAWMFSHHHNLTPIVPSKHLLLGSAVHEALAAYYLRLKHDSDYCVEHGIPHVNEAYHGVWGHAFYTVEKSLLGSVPGVLHEYSRLGESMLEQYMKWAPANDDFEVLAVEHEMVVPVHSFNFVGIADAIIKKKGDGTYWILENKTFTRIPEYRELLFSLQASAYMWAAQKTLNVPIDGVLYNILLKKQIKAPKMLKSGKLSKDVRQSTTREKVEEAIASLGLNPIDYATFLANLDKKQYNVRIPVVPTEGMLAWWERQLKLIGTQMIGNPRITPSVARSCTWCEFRSLCERIRNGMRWEPIAKTDFMQRERRGDCHD